MVDSIVNLIPHDVIIDEEGKDSIVLSEASNIARMLYEQEYMGVINNIPIYKNVTGWIKGLPPRCPGKKFIVSGIVFNSIPRDDLLTPNTSPWSVRRRGTGKITAVRSLLAHDPSFIHVEVIK
jgi:hypothetical protein